METVAPLRRPIVRGGHTLRLGNHQIPQFFSLNGIECQSLRQFASANETAARGWATGNTKASHGWLPIFPTFYSLYYQPFTHFTTKN